MEMLEGIKTRRSIRKFNDTRIDISIIKKVLEYARWAPSGLNHQPWKVIAVSEKSLKKELAKATHYGDIIKQAPWTLNVLLDKTDPYSYVKNIQSIGAFFQNLLLGAHDLGLGAVWLGEIYNQKDQVHTILGLNEDEWEFMGCVAIGEPAEEGGSSRKAIDDFTIWH